jgi:hypothetical protein
VRRVGLSCALVLSACVATGQEDVAVPLSVAGTAIEAPIVGKDDAQIVLSRAELAFGPLVLCAGAQAGELCETARLEWLDAEVVDAMDPRVVEVGALEGISGTVRSWMYDVGYASVLTQEDALELDAARDLDGASVRLEGVATIAGLALPFSASVVIRAEESTEVGVPVVRSSADDQIEHDVGPDDAGLLVRFDPAPWVSEIDFSAFVGAEGCVSEGPVIACTGTLEAQCDPAGNAVAERDCADLGEICVPGLGCAAAIEIEEGQGALAIRNQIVAGPRPEFRWQER